jgi:hypothetical protein
MTSCNERSSTTFDDHLSRLLYLLTHSISCSGECFSSQGTQPHLRIPSLPMHRPIGWIQFQSPTQTSFLEVSWGCASSDATHTIASITIVSTPMSPQDRRVDYLWCGKTLPCVSRRRVRKEESYLCLLPPAPTLVRPLFFILLFLCSSSLALFINPVLSFYGAFALPSFAEHFLSQLVSIFHSSPFLLYIFF